jgi:hypothetical protein
MGGSIWKIIRCRIRRTGWRVGFWREGIEGRGVLEGGAGSWASLEMRSVEFCQKIAAAWIKAHKKDLRIGLDNIPKPLDRRL